MTDKPINRNNERSMLFLILRVGVAFFILGKDEKDTTATV
jgi:hypothetical protein